MEKVRCAKLFLHKDCREFLGWFHVYLLLGMGFFDLKKYHLKKTKSLANLVHILTKILIFAEQLLS
jgi:hypothetical protein